MMDLTHTRTRATYDWLDGTPSINIGPSPARKKLIIILISFPCHEVTSSELYLIGQPGHGGIDLKHSVNQSRIPRCRRYSTNQPIIILRISRYSP